MKPLISISTRLLTNVEALNMVESIGNVTRHRRATIILQTERGYRKVEVPCLSGEAVAHAYQEALVQTAKVIYTHEGLEPPICDWCRRGEFFKSMDNAHTMPRVKSAIKGLEGPELAYAFEKEVINGCLVEDIGGFLRAERPPVKRTSRFQVGYLVPTADAIESTALESQFHVRHAASEAVRGAERAAQMIYYVETGSAVYGLCFNLDIGGIGETSMVKVEQVLDKEERMRRIRTALGGLLLLLSSKFFGAKRTRFLPIIEVKSIVAGISKPIGFTVEPPNIANFVEETKAKADGFRKILERLKIKEELELYAYSSEVEVPEGVIKTSSVEELLERLTIKTMEMVEES